jgi:hypothetical protein
VITLWQAERMTHHRRHRIENYGEGHTLVPPTPTAEYFEVRLVRHDDDALLWARSRTWTRTCCPMVRRLVRRLLDTREKGGSPASGAAEGYRVQCLIDAARRALRRHRAAGRGGELPSAPNHASVPRTCA